MLFALIFSYPLCNPWSSLFEINSEDSSSNPAITEATFSAVFKSLFPFLIVLATQLALFIVSAIVRAVLATFIAAKVPVLKDRAFMPKEAALAATLDLPLALDI